MKIAPFATEQYFSLYEFSAPHLLGVSDCETVTVEELLDLAGVSLADLGRLRLGYTESQGHPELRRAIAATYEGVADEEIVVLTSPIEGIYLAMRTLLDEGDHAVVLSPSYDSLRTMADHVCHAVDRWDLVPGDGRWNLDLEALERLIRPTTRLVVVNFPHNPTGFLPTGPQLEELVAIAREHDLWLFSDEMYRGLEFAERPTLPSVADRYERGIVLSGLSKAHGLPGLRSGWLVIRDRALRDELINWKHYTSICPSAPSEFLATAALRVAPRLVDRSREIVGKNVERASAFFERWSGLFDWRPPQAGSVALVGIDVPSATDYCHALARDAGVVLLPGPCLGADDRHVRFGFGRRGFGRALERFDEHLRAG